MKRLQLYQLLYVVALTQMGQTLTTTQQAAGYLASLSNSDTSIDNQLAPTADILQNIADNLSNIDDHKATFKALSEQGRKFKKEHQDNLDGHSNKSLIEASNAAHKGFAQLDYASKSIKTMISQLNQHMTKASNIIKDNKATINTAISEAYQKISTSDAIKKKKISPQPTTKPAPTKKKNKNNKEKKDKAQSAKKTKVSKKAKGKLKD